MRKVLIFGGSGMLGRALREELALTDIQVLSPTHQQVDIAELADVRPAIESWQPDIVVNCAGVRSGRSPVEMVRTNALGPHVIAQATDRPVIHISTDCVFGGRADWLGSINRWATADEPCPTDLYGRSKLAGEVGMPHVWNIRTSFVGPDHGLWHWLASQPAGATVPGYLNAYWTGSTVWAVAEMLAAGVRGHALLGDKRVVHLATRTAMSKLDVLRCLAARLGLDVQIASTDFPVIQRALAPTPGWALPSLDTALHARNAW